MVLEALNKCIGFGLEISLLGIVPVEVTGQGSRTCAGGCGPQGFPRVTAWKPGVPLQGGH